MDARSDPLRSWRTRGASKLIAAWRVVDLKRYFLFNIRKCNNVSFPYSPQCAHWPGAVTSTTLKAITIRVGRNHIPSHSEVGILPPTPAVPRTAPTHPQEPAIMPTTTRILPSWCYRPYINIPGAMITPNAPLWFAEYFSSPCNIQRSGSCSHSFLPLITKKFVLRLKC